jgi:GNAT superfamily N-acetyltransferase
MPFNIRRARPEDSESACGVLRRSIAEGCAEDHKGDPKILSAWLKNKTPENVKSWFTSGGYAVVAEIAGKIVGIAMLSDKGSVVLNYLVPEVRFRGIGGAMLAALESEARRRGFAHVELNSTATAHGFYVRRGYTDTGKIESPFGLSAPGMKKDLGPAFGSKQSQATVISSGTSPAGQGTRHP